MFLWTRCPRCVDDLKSCVVGGPSSPTQLYLVHQRGTEFWLAHGIVYGYACPGSFFRLQDPALVPEFAGTTTLSSNQVMQTAAGAVRRLARNDNIIRDAPPKVQYAGTYMGSRIPFFRVTWLDPGSAASRLAEVEIDGRTGTIVGVQLFSPRFWDQERAAEIERQTGAPEPSPLANGPDGVGISRPTTNYVAATISNWLLFCRRLSLDPGPDTDLGAVDWARSFIYSGPDGIGKKRRAHCRAMSDPIEKRCMFPLC